ncbi:MAG: hemoglobin/transferrin/lactoferrin receptor protein, partial [Bacteroidia bacterium]
FKNKQLAASELGSAYLYAKDENGLPYSPAWFTLNARSSVTLSEKFTLNLGIENILNKRYRPYGSGISAAGRNIIFGCKAIF